MYCIISFSGILLCSFAFHDLASQTWRLAYMENSTTFTLIIVNHMLKTRRMQEGNYKTIFILVIKHSLVPIILFADAN